MSIWKVGEKEDFFHVFAVNRREPFSFFENNSHQNRPPTSIKNTNLGRIGARLEREDQIGRQGLILYSQRLNKIACRFFELNGDGSFTLFPISYTT